MRSELKSEVQAMKEIATALHQRNDMGRMDWSLATLGNIAVELGHLELAQEIRALRRTDRGGRVLSIPPMPRPTARNVG